MASTSSSPAAAPLMVNCTRCIMPVVVMHSCGICSYSSCIRAASCGPVVSTLPTTKMLPVRRHTTWCMGVS